MNCENNFCIYCKNRKCILNSISLNGVGMCIDVDDITLEKEKQKLLKKYKEEDSKLTIL